MHHIVSLEAPGKTTPADDKNCLEVFLDRGIRETAALDKQSLEQKRARRHVILVGPA
jgi:hypothetical protein